MLLSISLANVFQVMKMSDIIFKAEIRCVEKFPEYFSACLRPRLRSQQQQRFFLNSISKKVVLAISLDEAMYKSNKFMDRLASPGVSFSPPEGLRFSLAVAVIYSRLGESQIVIGVKGN